MQMVFLCFSLFVQEEYKAPLLLDDSLKYSIKILQQDHHAVDILLAEVDIYELFAFKHCKGRKVKLALCEGIFVLFLSEGLVYLEVWFTD